LLLPSLPSLPCAETGAQSTIADYHGPVLAGLAVRIAATRGILE